MSLRPPGILVNGVCSNHCSLTQSSTPVVKPSAPNLCEQSMLTFSAILPEDELNHHYSVHIFYTSEPPLHTDLLTFKKKRKTKECSEKKVAGRGNMHLSALVIAVTGRAILYLFSAK